MKFLRTIDYATVSNQYDTAVVLRLLYEFWGYCVNGTTSLTTPGGIPSSGTAGPSGLFEGSTVLLTGNDGVTSAAYNTFTSAHSSGFTPQMIGKYLVIWIAGSTSTDDSIYKITGYNSSSQIKIDVSTGGTTDNSTLKPSLLARSAVNYRVVDLEAASGLVVQDGNFFVGTLSGASSINSGQASAQFQVFIRGFNDGVNQNPHVNIGITASPEGSWNGSAFTDTVIAEQNRRFFNQQLGFNVGNITIIADKTFFILHVKSLNSQGTSTNDGGIISAIIPTRIYSSVQDPNPLTIINTGYAGVNANNSTGSLANSFMMLNQDGYTRACSTLVKSLGGDADDQNLTLGPLFTDTRINYNQYTVKTLVSDGMLACIGTAGQYSLGRAVLRVIKFCPGTLPINSRVGNNGEGIHIGNGIVFPWDNAIPANILMPLGR